MSSRKIIFSYSNKTEKLYYIYNLSIEKYPKLATFVSTIRKVSGWNLGNILLPDSLPLKEKIRQVKNKYKRPAIREALSSLEVILNNAKVEEDFKRYWFKNKVFLDNEICRLYLATNWIKVLDAIEKITRRKIPREIIHVNISFSVSPNDYGFTFTDKILLVIHPRYTNWEYIMTIIHELLHSVLQNPAWYTRNPALYKKVDYLLKHSNISFPPGYPNSQLYFEENLVEALTLYISEKIPYLIDLPHNIKEICYDYWDRRNLILAKPLYIMLSNYDYTKYTAIDDYIYKCMKTISSISDII